MTDCPHGMPTPSSCLDCMDEGNLPTPPRPAPPSGASWEARYGGRCMGCDAGIHPGEPIRSAPSGVGYVHDKESCW